MLNRFSGVKMQGISKMSYSVMTLRFMHRVRWAFLLQVLDLQLKIANLARINSDNIQISLPTVCRRLYNNKDCIVESFLQYFQNTPSHLDKTALDKTNSFVMADYLDHFFTCITYVAFLIKHCLKMYTFL